MRHLIGKDHDKQKCPCSGWRRLQLWWHKVEHNASTPGVRKHATQLQRLDITNEHLTQVVNIPTREDKILDLLFTNCPGPVSRVKGMSPIGKADHDIVYVLRPNA